MGQVSDNSLVTWHGDPPLYLTFPALDAAGVRHAFTTRHPGSFAWVTAPGGPFSVPAGTRLVAALEIDGASVRFARQVHSTTVLVADGAAPGLVGTGDALVTTTPRCPLAVFTADCLAVVLVDPERRVLALAHGGWRGTVGGILGQLVGTMASRFGARADRLTAAIGPSIGPCCYEVDAPVVGRLQAAFPDDASGWVRPNGPGKWWLDLWQANTDQLTAAGVRPEAVANPRLCTACHRDLFFSYRKEGAGVRLGAVAVLE